MLDMLQSDGDIEKQVQRCILSYNTISISKPPATPKFGTFNPRPLQLPAVTKLTRVFVNNTFTPFAPQCAFPIIMYEGDLVEACVNATPSFDGSAPALQVKPHLKELLFCGGHHRVNAVAQARTELEEKMAECRQQITKARNDDQEKARDEDDEDGDDAPSPHIQLDYDMTRARLNALDTWGCIVYDKREQSISVWNHH